MKTLNSRSVAAYVILIALMAGMGIYSFVNMRHLTDKLYQINEVNGAKQRYAINFRGSVHDRSILVRDVVLAEDVVAREAAIAGIETLRAFYDGSDAQMQAMFADATPDLPEERTILERINQIKDRTIPVVDQIVADVNAGRRDQAQDTLMTQARPLFVEWLGEINRFIDID